VSESRREFMGLLASAPALSADPQRQNPLGPRFFVAAVTPVDPAGRLDEGLVPDLLAWLRERGADGVLVMGSNGEFSSFSVQERKRALEVYLRARNGLDVFCQIGTPNLPETLDLMAHAAGAGVEAVLVLPPFYYKNPPLEGLVRYYTRVLEAARIPVLLYHIPGSSGVPITPELLHKLEGHPRLYGLKDSSGDAEGTLRFIREFPRLRILTGSPRHIAVMLSNGAAGAITGNGNILARETAAVFRAFRQGHGVEVAQARLDSVLDQLRGFEGIPAMKFAHGLMGLRQSYCRPPFVEFDDRRKTEFRLRLEQAGLLA